MTDADRRFQQRVARWLLLGSPVVIYAVTFVELYVTFLVTRSVAPNMHGEIAARPVAFAGLITLVALPMELALMWAFGSRSGSAPSVA